MKPNYLYHCIWLFFLCVISCQDRSQADTLSLAGEWAFRVDPEGLGVVESWYSQHFSETVQLPGSMKENGKGDRPSLRTPWTASIYDSSWYFDPRLEKYRNEERPLFPFMLTPVRTYVGAAWYQKEVVIPDDWAGKRVLLFLERAHWETTVWVGDQWVGSQNSLVAPHAYDLSAFLSGGKNKLTVRVDNRVKTVNVGQDSHSISDHTQGNWNGIIGEIALVKTDQIWIDQLQVYPELSKDRASLKVRVINQSGDQHMGELTFSASSFNSAVSHSPQVLQQTVQIKKDTNEWEFQLPMGPDFLTWDEFDPALYRLTARLTASNGMAGKQQVTFGMREFDTKGTRFYVNDRPVFLRGNCDCAIFPLTGYPPMDEASWISLFKKQKSYGLNHIRYHSWCPPKAAFDAADKTGFYLQPEGPSWANHGVSLGDGLPIDAYIYEETNRINKYYGNSPSFCMLAYGNEPAGGRQAEYLNEFVTYWKAKDNRHVYTGASVGKSWPYVDSAAFIVKSYPRGVPVASLPNSKFDHHKHIAAQDVPYISHEIGQYCAYPNFKEIKKYTGVMKPRNFELFRADLKDHGMLHQSEDFLMASGKLQSLFYKAEIEAAFRTPDFAGFQLLQLNDFPGQGTALVGVLDAFFEEKGYMDSTAFTQFCDETVLLARLPKFVYQNDEKFAATLEISHFGKEPLKEQSLEWKITDEGGAVLRSGSFDELVLELENAQEAGQVSMDLTSIGTAQKLTLTSRLKGSDIRNQWEFWVYPSSLVLPEAGEVLITEELTAEVTEKLENGASVFLLAAGKVEHGKEIAMHFKPVFWNTSWFKMRPPHTLGHLTQDQHPAFENFPTESHSNYQWWEIVHKQQVMNLDEFPDGFRPLVQPIDTWFLNRKLALVFEARVGKGKLLVCSADLTSDWDNRLVARQLYYSLLTYVRSDKFTPEDQVSLAKITDLFREKERATFDTYSSESPDELMPKTK